MWTSADLALLPDNGKRYEIVDGELLVTRAPHWEHQKVCGRLFALLDAWSQATGRGQACIGAGLVLGEQDEVIPDVVWVSQERYRLLLDEAGHLGGKRKTRPAGQVQTLLGAGCPGVLAGGLATPANRGVSPRN